MSDGATRANRVTYIKKTDTATSACRVMHRVHSPSRSSGIHAEPPCCHPRLLLLLAPELDPELEQKAKLQEPQPCGCTLFNVFGQRSCQIQLGL